LRPSAGGLHGAYDPQQLRGSQAHEDVALAESPQAVHSVLWLVTPFW
jgi:hypothetical protein